jgi:hypothetical protein
MQTQRFELRSHALRFTLLAVALSASMLALGLPGCGGDDGGTQPTIHHPQDFLPSQVSGWDQQGEPQTGTTDGDLQAVIDGGYEIYTRHGMKEFAIADYLGSGAQAGATLKVWIFEMTSDQAALDLYNDSDLLPTTIEGTPMIGSEARVSPIIPVGKSLEFVRDAYYVEVEVSNASSEQTARNQAEFLAGNIDQEMTQ